MDRLVQGFRPASEKRFKLKADKNPEVVVKIIIIQIIIKKNSCLL